MDAEEIIKTAREIADKAAEFRGDDRDVDREMAYQQLTDLRTFLNMLDMLEMRIRYDGADNALNVMKNYKDNIRWQVDSITEGLSKVNETE